MEQLTRIIRYNEMFEFVEIFKTSQEFVDYCGENLQEPAKFDLTKLYNAMCDVYKDQATKYSTFDAFKIDFRTIFNRNIYWLNRKFELLNEDYEYAKENKTVHIATETIDETNNNTKNRTDNENATNGLNSTSETISKDTPQYSDIDNSTTGKINSTDNNTSTIDRDLTSNETNGNTRDYDRSLNDTTTNTTQTQNEMINDYLDNYDHFNYYDVADIFNKLFVNILAIF